MVVGVKLILLAVFTIGYQHWLVFWQSRARTVDNQPPTRKFPDDNTDADQQPARVVRDRAEALRAILNLDARIKDICNHAERLHRSLWGEYVPTDFRPRAYESPVLVDNSDLEHVITKLARFLNDIVKRVLLLEERKRLVRKRDNWNDGYHREIAYIWDGRICGVVHQEVRFKDGEPTGAELLRLRAERTRPAKATERSRTPNFGSPMALDVISAEQKAQMQAAAREREEQWGRYRHSITFCAMWLDALQAGRQHMQERKMLEERYHRSAAWLEALRGQQGDLALGEEIAEVVMEDAPALRTEEPDPTRRIAPPGEAPMGVNEGNVNVRGDVATGTRADGPGSSVEATDGSASGTTCPNRPGSDVGTHEVVSDENGLSVELQAAAEDGYDVSMMDADGGVATGARADGLGSSVEAANNSAPGTTSLSGTGDDVGTSEVVSDGKNLSVESQAIARKVEVLMVDAEGDVAMGVETDGPGPSMEAASDPAPKMTDLDETGNDGGTSDVSSDGSNPSEKLQAVVEEANELMAGAGNGAEEGRTHPTDQQHQSCTPSPTFDASETPEESSAMNEGPDNDVDDDNDVEGDSDGEDDIDGEDRSLWGDPNSPGAFEAPAESSAMVEDQVDYGSEAEVLSNAEESGDADDGSSSKKEKPESDDHPTGVAGNHDSSDDDDDDKGDHPDAGSGAVLATVSTTTEPTTSPRSDQTSQEQSREASAADGGYDQGDYPADFGSQATPTTASITTEPTMNSRGDRTFQEEPGEASGTDDRASEKARRKQAKLEKDCDDYWNRQLQIRNNRGKKPAPPGRVIKAPVSRLKAG
ncbi:hypothetical protein OQA88_1535 [Cercophora sp. LCS_1]